MPITAVKTISVTTRGLVSATTARTRLLSVLAEDSERNSEDKAENFITSKMADLPLDPSLGDNRMDFTVGVLLGTFVLSVLALFFFTWSMAQGMFGNGRSAATARQQGDLRPFSKPMIYYGAAGRLISTMWRPVR
jgi:hypothetical protein